MTRSLRAPRSQLAPSRSSRSSSACSSSSSSGRRPAAIGSPALSAQDLTLLVANLNTRQRPAARPRSRRSQRQLDSLELGGPRRRDVGRRRSAPTSTAIRAWSGLDPVAGRRHHDHGQRPDRRRRPSRTSSTSSATPAPRRSRSTTSGSSRARSSAGCPGRSPSTTRRSATRSRSGRSARRSRSSAR